MASETGTSRTADDIRDYLLRQLNSALRRPEMFGEETALRLYFEALAFTDRAEQAWAEDLSALRSREAFIPTGVTGAVERVLGHIPTARSSSSTSGTEGSRERALTGPQSTQSPYCSRPVAAARDSLTGLSSRPLARTGAPNSHRDHSPASHPVTGELNGSGH
jgi:hypothetical protein